VKKILLALMLISVPAYAEFDASIGPEISYISYREKNLPFGKESLTVKEDGVMYGIRGKIEYTDKLYLALDGKYSFGEVDYSGSGTIDDIEDYIIEAKGLIGFKYNRFVIYSGYGYRYLNDDGHGRITSTGLLGYERESNYHYIPIGIKAWDILSLELDPLIGGTQVSNLDRLGIGLPNVSSKQTRGVGFKARADFSKRLWNVDVCFGPFLNVWKIQDSEIDDGFYEPRNTSLEVGGQVAIKF